MLIKVWYTILFKSNDIPKLKQNGLLFLDKTNQNFVPFLNKVNFTMIYDILY